MKKNICSYLALAIFFAYGVLGVRLSAIILQNPLFAGSIPARASVGGLMVGPVADVTDARHTEHPASISRGALLL